MWNDDKIAAKSGFPPHPHRDMEIITYVRTGAITHQDSMGNKGRTAAGDVQVMSAGTGVTHAEYNLEDEETTLFQIWVQTDKPGAQPGWGAMPFPKESREGQLPAARQRRCRRRRAAHQCRRPVLGATLKAGETLEYAADPDAPPLSGAEREGRGQRRSRPTPRDGVAITGEKRGDGQGRGRRRAGAGRRPLNIAFRLFFAASRPPFIMHVLELRAIGRQSVGVAA